MVRRRLTAGLGGSNLSTQEVNLSLQEEWNSRVHSVCSTLDGANGFDTSGELLGVRVVETHDAEFERSEADEPVRLTEMEKERIAVVRAKRAKRLGSQRALAECLRQLHAEQAPHACSWSGPVAEYGTGLEDGAKLDDGPKAETLGGARRFKVRPAGPARWEHERSVFLAEQARIERACAVSEREAADRRNADEWHLARERFDLFLALALLVRAMPVAKLRQEWRRFKAEYRDKPLARYFRGCSRPRWDEGASAYRAERYDGVEVILAPTSPRLRLTGRQVAALEALAIDRLYPKCLGCEAEPTGAPCYRHSALDEQRARYRAEAEAARESSAVAEEGAALFYGEKNDDEC